MNVDHVCAEDTGGPTQREKAPKALLCVLVRVLTAEQVQAQQPIELICRGVITQDQTGIRRFPATRLLSGLLGRPNLAHGRTPLSAGKPPTKGIHRILAQHPSDRRRLTGVLTG